MWSPCCTISCIYLLCFLSLTHSLSHSLVLPSFLPSFPHFSFISFSFFSVPFLKLFVYSFIHFFPFPFLSLFIYLFLYLFALARSLVKFSFLSCVLHFFFPSLFLSSPLSESSVRCLLFWLTYFRFEFFISCEESCSSLWIKSNGTRKKTSTLVISWSVMSTGTRDGGVSLISSASIH